MCRRAEIPSSYTYIHVDHIPAELAEAKPRVPELVASLRGRGDQVWPVFMTETCSRDGSRAAEG